MATMPAKVVTLQSGKSIGAHKGFVATWNWLCSLLKQFATGKAAGKGLKSTGFVVGTPRMDVEIVGKGGVKATCGGPGMPYVISLTGSGGSGGGGDDDDGDDGGGGESGGEGGGSGGDAPSYKFVGTDSSVAVLGTAAAADVDGAHTVNFHTAGNSNVVVSCSGGSGVPVNISIGVYYT